MGERRGWRVAIVVALAALVVVPLVTGHPIASYARSGSMEPTLPVFAVFFVDPFPQDVGVGDIIVFDSISRGEPAVHRIVAGDPGGWYTRGDANPDVDQLAGEPPVTQDRILGRVLTTPDGDPILVPEAAVPLVAAKARLMALETKAGGPRKMQAYALLALAALAALAGAIAPPRRAAPRAPSTPRWRRLARRAFPRGILGRHVGLALMVALLLTGVWAGARATSVVPSTMVVVQDPGAGDPVRAAPAGGHVTRELRVGSLGLLPTLVIVEPGTHRVRPLQDEAHLPVWSTTIVAYEQTAGPRVGVQEDAVLVTRYPAILPDEATLALHRAQPGLPNVVLAVAFAAILWTWLSLLGIMRLPVGRWLGLQEGWL